MFKSTNAIFIDNQKWQRPFEFTSPHQPHVQRSSILSQYFSLLLYYHSSMMHTNHIRSRHAHVNASQRQTGDEDEDEEKLHHSGGTPKPSWANSHSRTKKTNISSSSPPVISVAFFVFGACLIGVLILLEEPASAYQIFATER